MHKHVWKFYDGALGYESQVCEICHIDINDLKGDTMTNKDEKTKILADAIKFAIKRLGFNSETLPMGSDLELKRVLEAALKSAGVSI